MAYINFDIYVWSRTHLQWRTLLSQSYKAAQVLPKMWTEGFCFQPNIPTPDCLPRLKLLKGTGNCISPFDSSRWTFHTGSTMLPAICMWSKIRGCFILVWILILAQLITISKLVCFSVHYPQRQDQGLRNSARRATSLAKSSSVKYPQRGDFNYLNLHSYDYRLIGPIITSNVSTSLKEQQRTSV